jgi:hypothetical protein
MAVAAAWDRVHPRLTHRAAWLDYDGDLPVIEGTLIRLQVDHLPGDRAPKPLWLWCSATGVLPAEVDRLWQGFLRRFDLETTFGEDKATITGAGNRTSGPVLQSGSPRLLIQEAWAWLTATQLVRASAAAALRGEHAAARALRRRNAARVTADEESFIAVCRHAVRSMTSTQVTALSSLPALAAAADAAARAALHTLNLPGRQRHSRRAQKARPKFPHATATKTTATGKPQVTVFAPG